ncbi:MAG: carbohydrate binding domain-containing protein [Candidatus Limnocylindrales bacterium]
MLTDGNIESGTTGWSVFGSGTISANTSVVHGGSRSLLITGRTASWNGISQGLTSKVTSGRSYARSAGGQGASFFRIGAPGLAT